MSAADDLARRALGWGAAAPLISDNDLVRDLAFATRANGTRDLACCVGAANLGQDLALALTTLLGSDSLEPGFGFDGMSAFAVATSSVMVRERLRASVAKLVAQDPRVRTVTVVEVSDASASETRTMSLDVEVDTIVGNGASLSTMLIG
jgi:hypothetical protein